MKIRVPVRDPESTGLCLEVVWSSVISPYLRGGAQNSLQLPESTDTQVPYRKCIINCVAGLGRRCGVRRVFGLSASRNPHAATQPASGTTPAADRPRVYIGRLGYHVREKDTQRFFSGYGRLLEDSRDANGAVCELDGQGALRRGARPGPAPRPPRLQLRKLQWRWWIQQWENLWRRQI